MDDISKNSQPQQSDNRLTSEMYDEFLDAIDLLYIRANLSGRLKFFERWPVAARYILGDELIGYDHNGTNDIERRQTLELEAEDKRLELLDVTQTLQKKSVEKSVLQSDYVESVVRKYGAELSLLMYAPKIVGRYFPEVLEVAAAPEENFEDVKDTALKARPSDVPDEFADVVPHKPKMPEMDDDHLDDVQPISLEPSVPVPPPIAPQGLSAAEEPDYSVQEKHPAETPPMPDELTPPMQESVPEQRVPESDSFASAPQHAPEKQPDDSAHSYESPHSPAFVDNPVTHVHSSAPDDAAPVPTMPVESEPAAPSRPLEPEAPISSSASPSPSQSAPPSDPTVQDLSQESRHKALDGGEPIASQKMTFMPSKQQQPDVAEVRPRPSAVPVIGGNKDKSED